MPRQPSRSSESNTNMGTTQVDSNSRSPDMEEGEDKLKLHWKILVDEIYCKALREDINSETEKYLSIPGASRQASLMFILIIIICARITLLFCGFDDQLKEMGFKHLKMVSPHSGKLRRSLEKLLEQLRSFTSSKGFAATLKSWIRREGKQLSDIYALYQEVEEVVESFSSVLELLRECHRLRKEVDSEKAILSYIRAHWIDFI